MVDGAGYVVHGGWWMAQPHLLLLCIPPLADAEVPPAPLDRLVGVVWVGPAVDVEGQLEPAHQDHDGDDGDDGHGGHGGDDGHCCPT